MLGKEPFFVVEHESHAVDPNDRAANRPQARGLSDEFAVAHPDHRGFRQAGDRFQIIRPNEVGNGAERVEPRPPTLVAAPGGNQVDIDAEPPPQLDGVLGLGIGPA